MMQSIMQPVMGPIMRGVMGGRRSSFSPRTLFAKGQQGAWYDPSDLSTLFQDAAGTIPVTATGQPVGLMRDKSGRGNHASQATAASRPIFRDVGGLRYLECDGVDDGMVTSSIDFTGTDKMFVCVGVRKLSDSSPDGTILETSTAADANNGAFYLRSSAGGQPNYQALSRGTIFSSSNVSPVPAPDTSVLTVTSGIATPSIITRRNGVQASPNLATQGTGNYGNYPLYLFRRGGTTLPFNGLFFGAVIAGAVYSAVQIAAAERYLAGKSGVTL